MYYPSSENKGADQLRGYREADLRLCFRLCRLLVFPRGGSNDKRKIEGHTTDAVDKQVWKKMDVKKANEKGNRENDVKNSKLKRTSKMGVLLVEPKSELKFKGKLNYPFDTNCLNAENIWFLICVFLSFSVYIHLIGKVIIEISTQENE